MKGLIKFALLVLALAQTGHAGQDGTAAGEALAAETELEQRPVAVLRALDKITARISELEARIDEPVRFGTLDIKVRYCRTRPPIEPPETFAYLEIDDRGLREGSPARRVFEGWMVASSPALNPLEHSVYDVWVIRCRAAEPDIDTPTR